MRKRTMQLKWRGTFIGYEGFESMDDHYEARSLWHQECRPFQTIPDLFVHCRFFRSFIISIEFVVDIDSYIESFSVHIICALTIWSIFPCQMFFSCRISCSVLGRAQCGFVEPWCVAWIGIDGLWPMRRLHFLIWFHRILSDFAICVNLDFI
jgi:hypothetical protein